MQRARALAACCAARASGVAGGARTVCAREALLAVHERALVGVLAASQRPAGDCGGALWRGHGRRRRHRLLVHAPALAAHAERVRGKARSTGRRLREANLSKGRAASGLRAASARERRAQAIRGVCVDETRPVYQRAAAPCLV
jgi:hypothetical protein